MSSTRKPWYRPRNVVLLVVALLLGLLGREVYLALTATPGNRVDYFKALQELVLSHQPAGPDAPDAWPAFLEAVDIADAVSAELRRPEDIRKAVHIDYSAVGYEPATNEYLEGVTYGEMQAWALRGLEMLHKSGLFEVQARLAAAPRAVRPLARPMSGHLIDVMLPGLGKARALARINAARLHVAHQAGDDAEFARAFEDMLALGRICAQQGLLIDQLVGVAIVGLAHHRARELLTERPVAPEALEAMLAALDRQLPLASPVLAIEAERISTRDLIQWTHTDNGRGSGRLIMSQYTTIGGGMGPGSVPPGGVTGMLQGTRLFNLGGVFFASKAATTRAADRLYDLFAEAAAKPRSQRADTMAKIEAEVDSLSVRYLVLKLVMPAIGDALRSTDIPALDSAGMQVMLALELYRHRTGGYPESLEVLAPAILPAVPLDPWHDQPFRYARLNPAEDELGRHYLLYSIGADGVDNGGRAYREAPTRALSDSKGAGLDYVFNLPRFRHDPDPVKPPEDDDGEGTTPP